MDKRLIYLDNSATTKISDAALDEYVRASRESFGNPSSLHTLGAAAERAISEVRARVLATLGARDGRVVFTASGSEANNLAIIGRATAKERYARGAKIITTDSEHASVNAPLEMLSAKGFNVVKISTRGGVIDLEELKKEMTRDVILVTVMMVNNETGALYDVKAVSEIVKRGAPDAVFHIDATQSYMKVPFTARSTGADMITLSSHKIHGPKGVGALYVSQSLIKTRGLAPIVFGGGQEGGLRSGTENVPSILAFGKALETEGAKISENEEKMNTLRAYLIEKIKGTKELAEISITEPAVFAPHILNITLPNIKSETMLHFLSMDGIYVSSGSACSSNSTHKSSALIAYGRTPAEADCSIRISFSHLNETSDIDALCDSLCRGISKLARIR